MLAALTRLPLTQGGGGFAPLISYVGLRVVELVVLVIVQFFLPLQQLYYILESDIQASRLVHCSTVG